MRIVKWQHKLTFVVGYLAVSWLLTFALRQLFPAGELAIGIFGSVVGLGAYVVGARVFRGSNEDPTAPRAWWRMTSKPKLSRRLGVLFIFVTGISALTLTLTLFGAKNSLGHSLTTVPDGIEDVIFYGILAFLYTNSAVRMKRLGVTSDPKRPGPLSSGLSKPKFPANS